MLTLHNVSGFLAVITAATAVSSAQETQRALHFPDPIGLSDVNFTKLFSSELAYPETWSREAWNGVTTYARTTPLRCFGTDSEVEYDVAVLGEPLSF